MNLTAKGFLGVFFGPGQIDDRFTDSLGKGRYLTASKPNLVYNFSAIFLISGIRILLASYFLIYVFLVPSPIFNERISDIILYFFLVFPYLYVFPALRFFLTMDYRAKIPTTNFIIKKNKKTLYKTVGEKRNCTKKGTRNHLPTYLLTENYKRLATQISKLFRCFFLILCCSKVMSRMKQAFHLRNVGLSCLKTLAFLISHIFEQAIIRTSRKKG
jgi:hypothetical protein